MPDISLLSGVADQYIYGLVALVVGWLLSRLALLGIGHIQNKALRDQILTLVKAAAQQIPDTTEGRKALVETGIRALGLKVPGGLVDQYIESAVSEFKASLGEMSNSPDGPYSPFSQILRSADQNNPSTEETAHESIAKSSGPVSDTSPTPEPATESASTSGPPEPEPVSPVSAPPTGVAAPTVPLFYRDGLGNFVPYQP